MPTPRRPQKRCAGQDPEPAADPLVRSGNPPHRDTSCPTTYSPRPCHRMVAVATSTSGRSSTIPPQIKNATVMLVAAVLMRLTRMDVISASLASIPGGPVEMAALATRYGVARSGRLRADFANCLAGADHSSSPVGDQRWRAKCCARVDGWRSRPSGRSTTAGARCRRRVSFSLDSHVQPVLPRSTGVCSSSLRIIAPGFDATKMGLRFECRTDEH